MPGIPVPYLHVVWVLVISILGGGTYAQAESKSAGAARMPASGFFQVELAQVREYASIQRYKILVSQQSGKSDSVFERELKRGKIALWVRAGPKGLTLDDVNQTVEALTQQTPGATRAAASVQAASADSEIQIKIDLPTRVPDRAAASVGEVTEFDPDLDADQLQFVGEAS